MTYAINESHDTGLQSWVESANDPKTDFPIQNLPFGLYRRARSKAMPRVGIAIGDQILDIGACFDGGFFTSRARKAAAACSAPSLNPLMSLGPEYSSALRKQLSNILRIESSIYKKHRKSLRRALIPMTKAVMSLPVRIGNYSDFYASIHHATTMGSMFRPDNPLLPNYKYIPIGYHGRASSIVISGTPIVRPNGQSKDEHSPSPTFGPCGQLDYELEVGCFAGSRNELGTPIPIDQAERHIFGLCLVNDWSARDIQRWEYQPLGPFLSKSFSTTISPWIVTREALAPFRIPAYKRPSGDPDPLPYLFAVDVQKHGGIDLTLEIFLTSQKMREARLDPLRLSLTSMRELYWTFAQMLTHHTSNGCNLQAGDLLASGTISGTTRDSSGSLIELTQRGARPIRLPTGEKRTFLEDGDEVILNGYCQRDGFARIGFGENRGRIVPSQS